MIAVCLDNRQVELTVQGEGPCLSDAIRQSNGATNVTFAPFVSHEETVSSLVPHDIGLAGLSVGNGLADYALPNKIFDYMSAGLAIICTRSRSVASLENSEQYIWFIDEPTEAYFSDAVKKLVGNPEELRRRKNAALLASRQYTRAKQKERTNAPCDR